MTRAYIARAGRSDWRTPENVLALVREAFGGTIGLDPCAPQSTPFIARVNIQYPADGWMTGYDLLAPPCVVDNGGHPVELITGDGLRESWGRDAAFVNPPFDNNAAWVRRCVQHALNGNEVILLIPARTDTRYWHDLIVPTADAFCLWKGRMRFVGAPSSAPFPSALIYWGPAAGTARFCNVFRPYGQVWENHDTGARADGRRETPYCNCQGTAQDPWCPGGTRCTGGDY